VTPGGDSAQGRGSRSVSGAIEPLDGDLVHLRPATPADNEAVIDILTDPTVAAWWQTADPATDALELLDDAELAIWLIEADGAVTGLIMAGEETDPQYRHAGIDIAVGASSQGRGLGSDAIRTVARWLIDVRGHHRLIIDPSIENDRAIRTYAKIGFRPVGTLRAYERWRDGSWHDGLLMDLLADELTDR
jgi:aminoglycoside 6'-N-acetyltransferase